jgi:peroxiredoxin
MLGMPSKYRRLIAVAAILVGVAGCSGKGQDPTAVNNGGFITGDGSITQIPVGDRQPAKDVSGTTLAGQPLDLNTYRGKVVVINFWSSDCIPCSVEAQAFAELAKEDASKGVQFVGIDERDNEAAARNFEAKWHMTYPSLFDQSASHLLDFPGAVPAGTPFTILLDRSGRIAAKVNGSLDYTSLRKLLNNVLTASA